MQSLWSRSIIAIAGNLPSLANNAEDAAALLYAVTGAWVLLTVPRKHCYLFKSEEFLACLHDGAMQLCPSPTKGVLASSQLPTWPCVDLELMALLETMGRICHLRLCRANLDDISFDALLRAKGPFATNRPPICDGEGTASTADHQAWKKGASKSK